MSEFRPMTECKGFNMERVLLKNKNGYMITAYFKDGMLQCDGDEDWTQPIAWSGFIRLRDLANGVDTGDDKCHIQRVSNCDFSEKCNNCANLGVWVGFGIDEEDMHICTILGAITYVNNDACEDYIKAK